eukprot:TRINITY_DN81710_c0_g1_i1.p1 TRINITY_DN81710_c0_g1~~TRINITY_DN81710_c0_g1_i1.p1  ORF type:complete len:270 (+),score=58.96 TRINITY_DN81710_c0_g1_i1:81-812(+)
MLQRGIVRLQRAVQEARPALSEDLFKRDAARLWKQGEQKTGIIGATIATPRVVAPASSRMNEDFVDFMLSPQDASAQSSSSSSSAWRQTKRAATANSVAISSLAAASGARSLFTEVDTFLSEASNIQEKVVQCNCPCSTSTALSVLGIWQQAAKVLAASLKGVSAAFRQQYSDAEQAFSASDENCTGYIEFGEFRQILSALKVEVNDATVRSLFHAADLNNDGRLDAEEFDMVLWRGRLEVDL